MHERLLTAAIEYDKGDPKRIQHFIKVHSFARLIGKQEKLSDEMMKALETAAILHDIGIHEGERLYGRNAYEKIFVTESGKKILKDSFGL